VIPAACSAAKVEAIVMRLEGGAAVAVACVCVSFLNAPSGRAGSLRASIRAI
jgi:hypothetical protein